MNHPLCQGWGIVLLVWCSLLPAEDAAKKPQLQAHWRHPIAMVAIDNHIYVANQRSGTLSILNAEPLEVSQEVPIGQTLSDMVAVNHGTWLATIDESAHELLLLEPKAEGVKLRQRLPVAKTPVGLAVDASGTRIAVSSLWAWRVTLVEQQEGPADPQFQICRVIDVPFAPRKMLWLAEPDRLIVADAFGGRLAILDPKSGQRLSEKEVAGHNIRGLSLSRDGKDLLIAQQVLDPDSKTMHTPVFWGDLMQNVLRSQLLADLLADKPLSKQNGDLFRTEPLGHPSAATGDPYEVKLLPGGQTVVSLSGVGEIAIRRSENKPFERFNAQARSTALLLHPDSERLLVANTFADSLTIFNLKSWEIAGQVSLGATPPLTQREQGERLFYDAHLSLDGWYSCHSCHTDGHTTGYNNDNLSDRSFGAPKRILPLGGVGQTGPWAWDANSKNLTRQIHSSIVNTMQGTERTNAELAALEIYLKTLKPAPSLDRMRGTVDDEAVQRGQIVFKTQGCADCHQPPTFTSPGTYDVSLSDELGGREFNPPSLLGVSQRQELFHDGRAKSLKDVLEKFQHGDAHQLTEQQRADLIRFLRSL